MVRQLFLLTFVFVLQATSVFVYGKSSQIAVIGPEKIDFGRYPANKRKEAVYEIINNGDEALKIIKIRKTCACAEVESAKNELAPGETAKIKAAIKADSIYGPYSKNFFIETNDPEQRFLCLTIAGNAIPIVEVRPKNEIYAGNMRPGETWRQSFSLEPTEKGVVLDTPAVKSSHPVKVSLTPASNGNYKLLLEMTPWSVEGNFNCKVKLPVKKPSEWKDIEIIVTGRVIPQK